MEVTPSELLDYIATFESGQRWSTSNPVLSAVAWPIDTETCKDRFVLQAVDGNSRDASRIGVLNDVPFTFMIIRHQKLKFQVLAAREPRIR